MKIRNGFVSNSSSSSFIILDSSLNDKQKEMLYNHIKCAKEIDDKLVKEGKKEKYTWYEDWFIESDGISLWCHTSMDNFDLLEFLIDEASVKESDIIQMGDGCWYEKPLFQEEEYKKFLLSLRKDKINTIKNKINEK